MSQKSADPTPVYPTYGVHNPPHYSPCASPDCLYARGQSGLPPLPGHRSGMPALHP